MNCFCNFVNFKSLHEFFLVTKFDFFFFFFYSKALVERVG